ncbi:unnamed protein product [Trichogramma brassicae]|uniref:Uncharacterized protein n=1 Tax=Trichogramma brassicae TaxID=86971 RepID=A0A6H5I153_9HYME|nr:unnamed protein product [Trichogramma brassicae]
MPQQLDTRHTCASCELQTFWEIEHQISSPMLSEEDSKFEQHFKETHYRDAAGGFVVSLPFKSDQLKQSLTENRSMVMKLYHVNEARTLRSPKIKGMYDDFMQEYLNLQHMRPSRSETEGNYKPHHCIFKNVDATPKIRELVLYSVDVVTTRAHEPSFLLPHWMHVASLLFELATRVPRSKPLRFYLYLIVLYLRAHPRYASFVQTRKHNKDASATSLPSRTPYKPNYANLARKLHRERD